MVRSAGWSVSAAPADFGFDDFVAHIDALLMGRRDVRSGDRLWRSLALRIATNTRLDPTGRCPPNAPASVRGAGEDDITKALLDAPGRIWIVGGGETLAFCLRRGLIDELQLFVMPILLGEGAPLTGRLHKNVDLALVKSEALARGVTKLTYNVEAKAAVHGETTETALEPAPGPPADANREALAPYPPEANAEQDA